MAVEEQLAEAFQLLEGSPEHRQALLRPLLVSVMRDPATLRVLGSHAVVDHILFVERVLHEWARMSPDKRPPLPEREEIFLNLTVGRGFDDVEEAFHFVRQLPGESRRRVEEAMSVALNLHTLARGRPGLSLPAVARLLNIALSRGASVEHFVKGRDISYFYDEFPQTRASESGERQSKGRVRAKKPQENQHDWFQSFTGALVHIVVLMPGLPRQPGSTSEPAAVALLGRCLQIGSNAVVIDVRPGDDRPEPVLIGMASIIQMRHVPEAALRRF